MEKYKAAKTNAPAKKTPENNKQNKGTTPYKAAENSRGVNTAQDKAQKGNSQPGPQEEEKSEEQRSDENNAKAVKAGIKVAKNAGGWVGAAATVADKIDNATGGMISDNAGKVLTKANKMAPGGSQVQQGLNKMGESGATDAIGNAADAKSGGASTGKAAASGASKSGGSSSNGSSSAGMSYLKIKLILMLGLPFFFLMIMITIVSGKDSENLGLTSSSDNGSGFISGGDYSSCSLTISGGTYYKTIVPQTPDCKVDAFPDNSWGLEPTFYSNIMALIEDAKSKNCNAVIISGHRSYEKQKSLYDKYRNQPGRAALPGYSNHEYGIAADLSFIPHSTTCVSYYHNNAVNFGLTFPLVHASFPEDWHIEPINIVKGSPQ